MTSTKKCICGAKGTRVVETQEGSKSYFCTPHFKRVMELLNKDKSTPYETPIKQSKARSTGTTVSLVAFPKDHPDGKWALICEEHAGIVHFDLKASAISYMASPESWCPGCQGDSSGDE